ncbi:MAG: Smr/MutS family protein [Spirochaetota bacterium]
MKQWERTSISTEEHQTVFKDAAPHADANTKIKERRFLRKMKPQAELDLHGLTVKAALERTDVFLKESKRLGLKKVLIIHGKGNHSDYGESVLKKAVHAFIQKSSLTGETGVPGKEMGGNGALWLLLR